VEIYDLSADLYPEIDRARKKNSARRPENRYFWEKNKISLIIVSFPIGRDAACLFSHFFNVISCIKIEKLTEFILSKC
jgi:hypothetical protein